MNKFIITSAFFISFCFSYSQNSLAKIEYSYAEEAFNEAKNFFESACNNKHAFSCNYLGKLYLNKNYAASYGIKRDKQKGKEFMNKACSLDPQFCE